MRHAVLAMALLALLALPLVAATRDDPLAGRVAGEPVDCIELDRVSGPEIVDARTILYPQNGWRVWRASFQGACPGVRPFATIVADVQGRRLCRADRFRIRAPSSPVPGGVCRFGRFTPYDKPAAPL